MWLILKKGKNVEIKIEYHSKMKKLGAYTLAELEEAYKNDAETNLDARIQKIEQQKLAALKA